MAVGERSKTAGLNTVQTPACVAAAFLQKFAKHLALIACFMILGGASGRFAVSEFGIFLMIVTAAALHSIGRFLEYRLSPHARLPRLGP
jgi:hypothetical protein